MKGKIKTSWNFGLLYKSDNDPQIKIDVSTYESAVNGFEKKYKDKSAHLKDSKKLLQACKEYESVIGMKESIRPIAYFYFRRDFDSNNKKVIEKINELSSLYKEIGNKNVFFTLDLAKIPVSDQKRFLKDGILKKYRYFLKNIFDNSKYKLSEPEEKVINLLSGPAYESWVTGFSKLLNNQEIKFKGKTLPINQAIGMIFDLKTKDRRTLSHIVMKKLESISDFAESEVNAVISKKKITDGLRGYEKPYSSIVRAYENEDATVENLVDSVTKNFSTAHRFYAIKSKLLKEKVLNYADRGAKIGSSKKKFNFDQTIEIVKNAFRRFDKKYVDIFESFLKNGQIDVYPKKGKKGGAYCWGNYGLPTFVLLNHTDTADSVRTLGHEMGHAFHSEMSHKQDPIYAGYTTSVAEVASTFFENFVFDEIFEKLSKKEKIIALHDKLNAQVSTVFRQIACFNFEKELHEQIRLKGYLAKEEIAAIMNKHMQNYLGPKFKLNPEDGYYFVAWSHIRRYFYVYSYAFGSIISDALYSEYKKDNKFIEKIEGFLGAGGSKSPEDIFADAGIDIRNPEFFKKGLQLIEERVEELERLVENM